jgi:GNAT superfamily N-acetyltransferase
MLVSDPEPLFVDFALARRLEMAEASSAVACAQAHLQSHPDASTAVHSIAGGWAVFTGPASPITQATGIGLSGEVTNEDFAALEHFFFSRGASVNVETSPFADASLFVHFARNGYQAIEHSSVLVRRVAVDSNPEMFPGLEISEVDPGQSDLWVRTVCQGFAEHFPVTDELHEIMAMFSCTPGARKYLAWVDGKVAGGAALSVRDGIAGFFGASTLPEYRRRGIQRELIRVRMGAVAKVGCEIALTFALVGSVSERNILRNGFRVAYTRTKFMRELKK